MPSITIPHGGCGELTFSCWYRSERNLRKVAHWVLKYHPIDPRVWPAGVRVMYRWNHEKRERINPKNIREFQTWVHKVAVAPKPLTQIIGFATKADIEVSFENLDHIDPRSEERRVGKEGRSRWSPYH